MKLENKAGLSLLGVTLSSILTGVFGYMFVKYYNQLENEEA